MPLLMSSDAVAAPRSLAAAIAAGLLSVEIAVLEMGDSSAAKTEKPPNATTKVKIEALIVGRA